MEKLAVYVHVPFCVRKCSYCDFNAYSGMGDFAAGYVSAVRAEISRSEAKNRRVKSVFFGGGTPTFLPAEDLIDILESVRSTFSVDPDAEITAEANPTTVDASKFTALRVGGINRLSIGVQAFDDRLLRLVDREHSADVAASAVRSGRLAGFENLSIDLMFALPGQSLADWSATLDRAAALDVEHISAYNLTIEPGTRFERLCAGGKLALPDEETEIAMFELAIDRLRKAGFEHYEVSNFAKPGYRSRHNLVYWRNEEYAGFGPGAVSYLDGRRWTNEKHPARYIAAVEEGRDLAVDSERLDPAGSLSETIIQGLRLRDGLSLAGLIRRYGNEAVSALQPLFDKLAASGMIERNSDRLMLTHHGLLMSNDVALELLPQEFEMDNQTDRTGTWAHVPS